jgi:hypothetical protein
LTTEKDKHKEFELDIIGFNVNRLELELLFMILNSEEKYIPRKDLLVNLKFFSGILIDEENRNDMKEIDDLLNGLCEKGYIEKENLSSEASLTPKAMNMMDRLTRNEKFWSSLSTKRWRQTIVKKNKYEGSISFDEVQIIKELIYKEEISLKYVLNEYPIESKNLRIMEKQNRIYIDHEREFIRRNSRFIEGIAESVHYLEMNMTDEDLEEWLKQIDILFKTQNGNISKSWRQRYATAYDLVKEFDTCPVGLSGKCKYVFKKDWDNITPTKQLSIREMNLKINIKKGFGFVGDKRYSFEGLVIEFIQSKKIGSTDWISFNGSKQEMLEFFENIRKEAKKMSEESKIQLEPRSIGEAEIVSRQQNTIINIAVLAETRHEKISALSYDELNGIISTIQRYP